MSYGTHTPNHPVHGKFVKPERPSREMRETRDYHVNMGVLRVQLVFALIITCLVALTFIGKGTAVYRAQLEEVSLESNMLHVDAAHSFTLEGTKVMAVNFDAVTAYNSWVWVRMIVLDDQDRVVRTIDEELYKYQGSDWSEARNPVKRYFTLPAGTYRVLVVGEDAKYSSPNEMNHDESVVIQLRKGLWLKRYFVILLVLIGLALFIRYSSATYGEFEREPLPLEWLDPVSRKDVKAAARKRMGVAFVFWGIATAGALVMSIYGVGLPPAQQESMRGEPMMRSGGFFVIYSGGPSGGHGASGRMNPGGPGAGK
ncbi:MAG: hypothetical protein AAGI01_00605 [Myxococcota bacterium]